MIELFRDSWQIQPVEAGERCGPSAAASFLIVRSRGDGKRYDLIARFLTLSFEEGCPKRITPRFARRGRHLRRPAPNKGNNNGKLRRKRFNVRIRRSFSVW